MATITAEQAQAISERLATHRIAKGVGTEDQACSIASINLALSGVLTDKIPACMSEVIGKWIIGVQDAMPDELRNSDEWRNLLPLAAGTGREHEQERASIIMDWMWGTVLPQVQPLADERGYGAEWRTMTEQRTGAAAYDAATATTNADDPDAYDATYAADAAANAANDPYATYAADAAANAAAYTGYTAYATYWQAVDPCGLLGRLVGEGK